MTFIIQNKDNIEDERWHVNNDCALPTNFAMVYMNRFRVICMMELYDLKFSTKTNIQ